MCIISALVAGGMSVAAAWMATISAAAGIIGTAAGITGGVMSGVQANNQAKYQAEIARQNAKTAQMNAEQKRQEGIEEARLTRMKNLQKIGSQQAAMAANGFDVGEGTAVDVIEDTATMGELDALTIQYNKETQAQAYEAQANNYQNQANLDIISGRNAMRAGMINGVTSGMNSLASTASVAQKWYSPNSIANQTTRVSGGIYGDEYLRA